MVSPKVVAVSPLKSVDGRFDPVGAETYFDEMNPRRTNSYHSIL